MAPHAPCALFCLFHAHVLLVIRCLQSEPRLQVSVHDEELESAIGDDEAATTLVRKKMRRTEKEAAKVRLAEYDAKLASGTSRKLKRTDSEKNGEIKLGTISYKGEKKKEK